MFPHMDHCVLESILAHAEYELDTAIAKVLEMEEQGAAPTGMGPRGLPPPSAATVAPPERQAGPKVDADAELAMQVFKEMQGANVPAEVRNDPHKFDEWVKAKYTEWVAKSGEPGKFTEWLKMPSILEDLKKLPNLFARSNTEHARPSSCARQPLRPALRSPARSRGQPHAHPHPPALHAQTTQRQ